MKSNYEITYGDLLYDRYRNVLKLRTTEDIDGSDRLIGQERAEKSMMFGVSIEQRGYNIYISGQRGTGKFSYALKTLMHISKNNKTPDDWCYVYNFENEYEPIAVHFQPGMGKIFKQDMEYIINEALVRIPEAFNSEEYDKQKNEILEDYHDSKNELIDKLNLDAESYNIQIKGTSNGLAFTPIINEKPMSEQEYDRLEKEQKEEILKNVSEIRVKAVDILRKLKNAEKEADEKVKRLDKEIGTFVLEELFSAFKKKYQADTQVFIYLNSMKEDMLKNLGAFIDGINKQSMSKEEEDFLIKYKVNLVVDNCETRGAPVVLESNPTYTNLIGNVEYESKQGTITTDFLRIHAGSIMKANGGYLILNIEDVLRNFQSWEALKRVLKSGEVKIEGIRNQLELLTVSTIRPIGIPVSIKVVLIGSESLYRVLYEVDEEFPELFKVKVNFDSEIDKTDDNIFKTAQFISSYCTRNNIRHLDSSGVSEILQYSSRLAGSRRKLTAVLQDIIDIIDESNIWAGISKNRYIDKDDVKKAIIERKKRSNLIEDKMLELYKDKKIIININDKAIGQINGLSVVETGFCAIGKPCRITASTYMGKGGIINIEREAQMSGNIHSKGIMILTGYIGEKYAKNLPLSITAHICFEQLYGLIDGDSASIAELYAILSSISGIPLKQSIAVTGSLNQKGEVQPVGGINEKIEGFYKVCSLYGLNHKQGVIIPYNNIDDILLEDDIMKDIKNGIFHIYAIKNVEEGIEMLTDMRAGTREGNGPYPENTFNYYVDTRLKEYIRSYDTADEQKPSSTAGAKERRN